MRRTTLNQKANRKMKQYCIDHDIYACELCYGAECHNFGLGFAHRHKRHWYLGKPEELLWDRKQWRLLGQLCHARIEYDKKLTEEFFETGSLFKPL